MSDQIEAPDSSGKKRRFRVTRRGFLIGLGSTGVGLALGVTLGRKPFYRFVAGFLNGGETPASLGSDPLAWFEVYPDNRVKIFVSKVEMGQGIHTAIGQIAGEELDIPWENIEVAQGGTAIGPDDSFGTGGSNSVVSTFEPARMAAATLRQMILLEGARKLGVTADKVETNMGTVRLISDNDKTLTYGDIVAGVTEWAEFDGEVVLKPTSEFAFIGQSLPRVDLEAKIRGEATYGYDVRVDNMLYGAVAHSPTIAGKMISASAGDAEGRPGVVKVVIDIDAGFAGVVAKTRQQAQSALGSLEIEWDSGKLWSQEEIDALFDVSDGSGIVIQKEGQAESVVGDSPTLTADYATPFAIHAHLEPQAALVDVKDGKAVVYASIQMQGFARTAVAEVTGIDEENIEVTPTYLGGGFGRKLGTEATEEAARLSMAVQQPVHVGWTRPQDMRDGYFRPPTRHRLSAKLEGDKAVAINHNQSSGEVAFPFLPGFLAPIMGTDFGSWRGAFNFYGKIENRQLSHHLAALPVLTGWWRGLGLLANTFATESFMDEMAHTAGVDPLQFRLDHLGDDAFGLRMKAVLVAVAEKADYEAPLPAGHALGIACSVDVDTVVAMVAEVSVDEAGAITVHRAVQALDPGLVINPDGALAQTQGSIVMGLSSTLLEEMTITNGVVRPRNFDGYPLITIDRTPDIQVVFLESDGKPRGMGEPPIGPVAAAVGNAVFNLTGGRVRQLPMTPERVLAAIA
ncbi:MAG: isoquinoline 1-oxidoreductase beta subunit [Cellvibrionaceae bacterium]|jgi:isoquinoline 1-oxidoreductase beta subunit